MKILSLNCHCGKELSNHTTYEAFIRTLTDESFDLILLQEVPQSIDSKIIKEHFGVTIKEDNLAKRIVDDLGQRGECYHYVWDYSHLGFDLYEEGLAILSKEPFVDVESRYVSKSHDKKFWKSRLVVRASISGCPYDFITGHFGWENDQEEPFTEQWKNLCLLFGEKPLIIGGDFNNAPDTKAYQGIIHSGFADLVEKFSKELAGKPTFYAKKGQGSMEHVNINQRIDYFFSNVDNLVVSSTKRIFDIAEEDLVVSDHVGIVVSI